MPVKSVTPRQQDRRDRILECTRRQVARHGYDGLSMRELAVEADVSTATLYNLFTSKDELILAASEELLAGIEARVLTEARGLIKLIAGLEATADVIVANPNYAAAMGRMLFAADASAPVVKILMDEPRRRYVTQLMQMSEDGQLVSHVEIGKLARSLAGGSWSVILMWMKGFIALHDFKAEYVGETLAILLPWMPEPLQKNYRRQTGLVR